MGRGYRIEISHGLQNIFRKILYACDALCVNNLKANAGNFTQIPDASIQKMLQHSADGLTMGGENGIFPETCAGKMIFVIAQAFGSTNALRAAGCENLLTGIHIKQLILQRGTANIANQNIHSIVSCVITL
jgi:hypothetical protein